eukprot:CAMPEP_0117035052 /NCGR_PEP_ID=MMETSP0472-20121206/24920_1 /TAXON_ID=693140 ORGANISM="Tiarina fusus, Strain LIS" /NCGR_SAMPLE_ID=MMETSP0472 /ASSEMBLY_ACC=CAM_ASM_000603 /LENGTH=138 /DNA_ID=CAMNT_0004744411 /DNA_START=1042 /DNA_END=1458 /DNA_ORIENTATION=-
MDFRSGFAAFGVTMPRINSRQVCRVQTAFRTSNVKINQPAVIAVSAKDDIQRANIPMHNPFGVQTAHLGAEHPELLETDRSVAALFERVAQDGDGLVDLLNLSTTLHRPCVRVILLVWLPTLRTRNAGAIVVKGLDDK